MAGLTPINRAFNRVPKRAESRAIDQLRDTFVDSGVSAALESIDHQVLYGRRGTGKTHALRYLESVVEQRGDIGVYLDLRTIGSAEGLYETDLVPATERTARLLVDLIQQFADGVLEAALNDDRLVKSKLFVNRLDALYQATKEIRVGGQVEVTAEGERTTTARRGFLGSFGRAGSGPEIKLQGTSEKSDEHKSIQRETRQGSEKTSLNFSELAHALRGLAETLNGKHVWLILDEWSSVPRDVQPLLGSFLHRCLLPNRQFTVKIGAIEQQTNFREVLPDGTSLGLELGADIAANIDLDDFMVFDQNQHRAREFFRGLLFKHLTAGVQDDEKVPGLRRPNDLVRIGFTDERAFTELVRAAEGVPRDAINIAAKAALRASERTVSVPDVRAAARSWFQSDKEAALKSRDEAQRLLNWIIDKVIKQKRARGFLLNQTDSSRPLIMSLFDARVLHLVRRGYSAQDEPGQRYDVFVIDYGAYVDLIQTQLAPAGTLPLSEADGRYVEVPTQDLRAIRRAVLDLSAFEEAADRK